MAVKKKNRKKKEINDKDAAPKKRFREKFSDVFELPKEVVLNIPKITMIGDGNLFIENYKGIIEYENDNIRINTSKGIIRIAGMGLEIKQLTSENILIDGSIRVLEFMN